MNNYKLSKVLSWWAEQNGVDGNLKAVLREASDKIVEKSNVPNQSGSGIYSGCIRLIDEALFGEYGVFNQIQSVGIDLKELLGKVDEGGDIGYYFSNFQIIQELLLKNTNHAGGTSTREKCREMGLNPDKNVEFSLKEFLGEEQ